MPAVFVNYRPGASVAAIDWPKMRWKLDHQFENCPKLFEEKIPHWSTKNVAKKKSVANEPSDRWLSIHVIKLYDLKFKALLI